MNYELILSDELLLVSDEEIKEGDYIFSNNSIKPIVVDGEILTIKMLDFEHWRKVIAGTPSLPKITFSEEAYQQMKERFGWADVHKAYQEESFDVVTDGHISLTAFAAGFKLCQSLNKSRFSEEDMNKAIEFGIKLGNTAGYERGHDGWIDDTITNFFKQQRQPKRVKVEVEMENYSFKVKSAGADLKQMPKISNNTIKITRLC